MEALWICDNVLFRDTNNSLYEKQIYYFQLRDNSILFVLFNNIQYVIQRYNIWL